MIGIQRLYFPISLKLKHNILNPKNSTAKQAYKKLQRGAGFFGVLVRKSSGAGVSVTQRSRLIYTS